MGIPAPFGISAAGLPLKGDQANAYVAGKFTAVGPGKPFAFRGPMNLLIFASITTSLLTTAGSLAATLGSGTGLAIGDSVSGVNVPEGSTLASLAGTAATLALPTLTYPATGLSVSSPLVTLPPGSNVNALLGATVTAPSPEAESVTIPGSTTVAAIIQTDVAPISAPGGSAGSPGSPGIIQLSAAPTLVPALVAPVPLEFALTDGAIVSGTDAAAFFTGAGVVYVGVVQIERSFDGGKHWIVCNIGASGTLAQFNTGTPVSLTFGEPEKQVLYRLNCTAYSSGTINYRISQTGGAAESLAIGPLSGG